MKLKECWVVLCSKTNFLRQKEKIKKSNKCIESPRSIKHSMERKRKILIPHSLQFDSVRRESNETKKLTKRPRGLKLEGTKDRLKHCFLRTLPIASFTIHYRPIADGNSVAAWPQSTFVSNHWLKTLFLPTHWHRNRLTPVGVWDHSHKSTSPYLAEGK